MLNYQRVSSWEFSSLGCFLWRFLLETRRSSTCRWYGPVKEDRFWQLMVADDWFWWLHAPGCVGSQHVCFLARASTLEGFKMFLGYECLSYHMLTAFSFHSRPSGCHPRVLAWLSVFSSRHPIPKRDAMVKTSLFTVWALVAQRPRSAEHAGRIWQVGYGCLWILAASKWTLIPLIWCLNKAQSSDCFR